MLQENELITFLLFIGALLFLASNTGKIRRIPHVKIFLIAALINLAGNTFTILEGYWLGNVFNLIEHACYALSTVVLAIWTYLLIKSREGAGPC